MTCWRGLVLVAVAMLNSGCLLFDTAGSLQRSRDETLLPRQESAKACMVVGENLASQGHTEQAIMQYLKAREYDPKVEVSAPLARLYSRANNDKLARDEFEKALKAQPKDAELWNDLGWHEYQRGNWSKAEEAFTKATSLNPKFDKAWMNLGLALGQQGKYPEALAAFEKAVRPAEARCNLAFVLLTQKKPQQARELYEEALRLDPGLQLARMALARLNPAADDTE
ncbi:MAG: tetratricopeptide repeat protein [Gemmataceae bacterium]